MASPTTVREARECDSHGPCYISTLVADPSSFNADADDREHWDETDEVGW